MVRLVEGLQKLTCSVSAGRRAVAIGLVLCWSAGAQSTPASRQDVAQPTSGGAVFDKAGNTYYYLFGPVTAGAAQTQPGGGTCYWETGFIGPVPLPCTDAHIVKVDPQGNVLYGTLLGGPTADNGSALAVDAAG